MAWIFHFAKPKQDLNSATLMGIGGPTISFTWSKIIINNENIVHQLKLKRPDYHPLKKIKNKILMPSEGQSTDATNPDHLKCGRV